jgi:methionyl-tRNA formyltransferase
MTAPAPTLNVALFGTPSCFSTQALQQLAVPGFNITVILAQPERSVGDRLMRFAGLRRVSSLARVARERGIAVIAATASNEPAMAERLRSIRPDLICVATFPRRISQQITEVAALGAINVHPSLLPRHRGPLPLFWTYHADDRMAGVTVHHTSQVFDAGDIIMQEGVPLPRGYPAAKLDEDLARRGAFLLRSAAQALACGRALRVVQDERAATYAPRVGPGTPMVNFDEWDVERVWHFLAGLCPRFREPLTDKAGRPARYRAVAGFQRGASGTLGSVDTIGDGWRLHCRGGVVLLANTA